MSQKALPSLDSTHTLTPINTEKINYNFFSDDEENTEHHLTATSKINNTITTKTRNTRKNSRIPQGKETTGKSRHVKHQHNYNANTTLNTNKNITNKTRDTKNNSQNKIQQADDSDSLQYSSTASSTKSLILRPSSTIRMNSDIDSLPRDSDNNQWKFFFGNSTKKITKITSSTTKKYSQIKLKVNDTDNRPFGDDIHGNNNGVKIMFHNINGIKDEGNWHQIMTTM
jgi:hypothetical protein